MTAKNYSSHTKNMPSKERWVHGNNSYRQKSESSEQIKSIKTDELRLIFEKYSQKAKQKLNQLTNSLYDSVDESNASGCEETGQQVDAAKPNASRCNLKIIDNTTSKAGKAMPKRTKTPTQKKLPEDVRSRSAKESSYELA